MHRDEPGHDELLARSLCAAALAQAFADPLSSEPVAMDPAMLRHAWDALVQACEPVAPGALLLGELEPTGVDIQPLLSWLARDRAGRLAAHQEVFGLVVGGTCPPCETEYCHWSDPTYRAQQMADIAGFYRAFGVQPDPRQPLRCDHVALEIGFVSLLLQKQHLALCHGQVQEAAVCANALVQFLGDHLAWWLPTFARAVEHHVARLCEGRHGKMVAVLQELSAAAMVLRGWIAIERFACGVETARHEVAQPPMEPVPLTVGATEGDCQLP